MSAQDFNPEKLVGLATCGNIPAAVPFQQKAKRYMSKRSGQSGSVKLVGQKWYGRYWRDVPGKDKREHPLVVLGNKSEMTKPEAKRALMDIIAKEGVNTAEHLAQAMLPVVPFLTLTTWLMLGN